MKKMSDKEAEQIIDNFKKEFTFANVLIPLIFIGLVAAGLNAYFNNLHDNNIRIVNAFNDNQKIRCVNTVVSKKNGFKLIEKTSKFTNGKKIYNVIACREI